MKYRDKMRTEKKEYGDLINFIHICIDEYEDDIMQGRIYHGSHELFVFHSAIQMCKMIEAWMDYYDFPQSGMQLRSFQKKHNTLTLSKEITSLELLDLDNTKGKKATFDIRILFRQNATWQGIIQWVENGSKIHFRSAMEMLCLIDSCFIENGEQKELVNNKKKQLVI